MVLPQLPLDVLTVICNHLPDQNRQSDLGVKALARCTQVNRLFREAALLPTLWKRVYDIRYTISDDIKEDSRARRYGSDWRSRYYARRASDRQSFAYLDDVVYDLPRQPESAYSLTKDLLDVWDALQIEREQMLPPYFQDGFPQRKVEVSKPQAMTRKYWAARVMDMIPAMQAIELWGQLRDNPDSASFEDAFNSLSGFFGVPIPTLTKRLDDLASQCRGVLLQEGVIIDRNDAKYDLKLICQRIHQWMYSIGFKGAHDHTFHSILNSFPHSYLYPEKHRTGTIQLSLVHAFVGISRRLDIESSPTNFPRNVLAHIRSRREHEEDFYVDMFKPTSPLISLRADIPGMLMSLGIPPAMMEPLIAPVSPSIVLIRAAHNAFSAIRMDVTADHSVRRAAFAPAACVMMMFDADPGLGLLSHLQSMLDADIVTLYGIFQKTLLPLLAGHAREEALKEIVNESMQEFHQSIAAPQRRTGELNEIKFFVGMIFQHQKYGYLGVITGWDGACKAHEGWIQQMAVDALPRGRGQPFYNVLSFDGSSPRYVAEENIGPVQVTRAQILEFYGREPSLGKHFEDVEHHFLPSPVGQQEEETKGYARFLLSPEAQLLYPEDMQAGNEWIVSMVTEGDKA